MPPEDSVRPWMLIYYSEDKKLTADQFWKDFGKEAYEKNKSRMKANDEVKQTAAKAVGDATTPGAGHAEVRVAFALRLTDCPGAPKGNRFPWRLIIA